MRSKHLPDQILIYISDHGESLGEYGIYLHGISYALSPGAQIPRLESQRAHSQRDIFHSVMGAFSMRSEAYASDCDIFSEGFSNR
jgi:lipid A ethanolaminephosphotransferase